MKSIVWTKTITSEDCQYWLGKVLDLNVDDIDWEDICEIYYELYDEDLEEKFCDALDNNVETDDSFLYYLEEYYLFEEYDKDELIDALKALQKKNKRNNKIENLLD